MADKVIGERKSNSKIKVKLDKGRRGGERQGRRKGREEEVEED